MAGFPESRMAVDKLRKAEAAHILEELGETVPKAWTVEEVKAKLKEVLFSEEATGPKMHLKRLTSKTKQELIELCDAIGAHRTKHMLKGDLMRAIRARVRELSEPVPSDILEFGRYKEMTYGEVYRKHTGYCTWVKEAARTEPSPQPALVRFAGWLNIQEVIKEEAPVGKEPTEEESGPHGTETPKPPPQPKQTSRPTRRS